MIEQALKEKIAEMLPCFRDIFDRMPCPFDGECSKCGDTREAVDHLVIMLKEAGYVKLAKGYKAAKDEDIEIIRDTYNKAYEKSRQDTLKAIGEWLTSLTISGNAVANELRIVQAIAQLKRGEMPR